MEYIEMQHRKNGVTVKVYDITNGIATIFDPTLHAKANNGWGQVNVSKLVPMEYPLNGKETVSKTTKNKAKARMKIVDAIWQTSDSKQWNHSNLDDAIDHEIQLMNAETNNKDIT